MLVILVSRARAVVNRSGLLDFVPTLLIWAFPFLARLLSFWLCLIFHFCCSHVLMLRITLVFYTHHPPILNGTFTFSYPEIDFVLFSEWLYDWFGFYSQISEDKFHGCHNAVYALKHGLPDHIVIIRHSMVTPSLYDIH